MRLVDQDVGPYERVVWAHDPGIGLQAVVAVHSTVLGPAVGGCRCFPYPDQATAVIDCLRLAEGMTLKSTAAGLDIGGGKAVIIGDPATVKTPELLAAFAEVLNHLGGDYYTAEDVGTTTRDMDVLRERTPYVLGVSEARGGGGDPSPYTAQGVMAAMRAAWRATSGADSLSGAHIVVQGVGKVGAGVARLAAEEGARVSVSDVAAERVAAFAGLIGAEVIAPEAALAAECDILAPCAMGGVLNPQTIPRLRCRLVCGAANNMLAGDDAATMLQSRGIDYVPDFIANAGGIIAIADEMHGFDPDRAMTRARGIGDIVARVIAEAMRSSQSALAVAERMAAERLEAAQAARPRARHPRT